MAKEKLSPEEINKKRQERQKINMLRGVLAAGLTAVAMETGTGKVMTAEKETDKKIEPVTQTITPERSPIDVNPSELPPDTIAMPEIKPMNMEIPQPAGIPIPEANPTVPQINLEQDEPYNYEDIKQLCEEQHYDLCTDMLSECEDLGYGKQELAYEDKLELAGTACDLEMSQIMNENMLPAFDAMYQSMDKMSQTVDNYTTQSDLNDPITKAKLKSDVRGIKRGTDKSAGKCMKSYKEMSGLAKDAARIHHLGEQYDKTGQKVDEDFLDKKINKMYKHAKNFSKEYEEKEQEKEIQSKSFDLSKIIKNSRLNGGNG